MSVAFRRESDEEHLEPKFELPIPPGPNLVTARGVTLIEERLAALDEQLSAATGGEVENTGGEVEKLRRERRYWQTRRSTARLTEPPTGDDVGFGSTVDIILAGKRRRIAIVGDDEADPKLDAIAFSAPLARAIMGAEQGDRLPFNGRDDAIEVIAVHNRPH